MIRFERYGHFIRRRRKAELVRTIPWDRAERFAPTNFSGGAETPQGPRERKQKLEVPQWRGQAVKPSSVAEPGQGWVGSAQPKVRA